MQTARFANRDLAAKLDAKSTVSFLPEKSVPTTDYVTAYDEGSSRNASCTSVRWYSESSSIPRPGSPRTRVENDTLFPMRMFLCRVMADK